MKKINKLLLLCLPLLIAACNKTPVSQITSNSISNSINSSESSNTNSSSKESSFSSASSLTSSSASSSNSSVSSSSKKEIVIKEGETLEGNKWNEEVLKTLEYTIGDVASKIPSFTATMYTSVCVSQDDTDLLGNDIKTKIATIKCLPIDTNNDLDDYNKLLKLSGFIYSYDYECYIIKASNVDIVYLYTSISKFPHTNYYSLDIEVFRKTMRFSSWNEDAPVAILGKKIPQYKADSYEYYFDPYTLSLTIYLNGCDLNDNIKYQDLLTQNQWVKTSTDAVSDKFASKDGWLHIDLYNGLDSFGEEYLQITLSNDWPLFLIEGSLGHDIPKLGNPNAVYMSYTTGQDNAGDYYTDIGYANAGLDDYNFYVNSLLAMGFKYIEFEGQPNPSVPSDDSESKIYSSYLYEEDKDGNMHELIVLYSPSYTTQLLIIIYA